MKYSLMTTTMVLDLLIGMQQGLSPEQAKEKYRDMMAMVADTGIPAVEVTSMELDLFGYDTVKEELKNNGLVPGGFVHMDCYACTDEDKTGEIVEKAKQRIDDAASLGADNLMLALMAQEDVAEHSQEELAHALVRNILPIAAYGKEKGILVSVEDTPDIRLPLCDTADTKALLDAVPDLYLTFDTGNTILKHDDPLDYYHTFCSRVCHVHLKDMAYREPGQQGDVDVDGRIIAGCQPGEGIIDFEAIGASLKEAGYDGYAVIEYVGKADEDKISDAFKYLKGVM